MLWALALLWGASYLFIKVALDDLSPVFLVFARLALAAMVLVPLAIRTGGLREIPARWRPLLLLAMVQVVVPFLLITYGERHVASSLTGILIASSPIFTALLGMAGFGAERTSGWSLAGVLLGIVGVAMLFGVDLSGSSEAILGGGMIVLAALGYAIGAIYLRKAMASIEPIAVAASTMTLSAVLLLPAAAYAAPDHMPALDSLAAILALGLLGTGVAFAIYYRLIVGIGAHKSAVVAYLAPGFALGYGSTLLGEPISLGAVGGLLLILLGSYSAAQGRPPWRARRRPAPVAAPA
jgi:drug/metabolite transporter (DMT)-like permease